MGCCTSKPLQFMRFSRRSRRFKENVIEFEEECDSLRKFKYIERIVQNQEEVDTAGGNVEDEFEFADLYIDDDGLGEVAVPVNERSSTSSGQEFEFCDDYIEDHDGIQPIGDRKLEFDKVVPWPSMKNLICLDYFVDDNDGDYERSIGHSNEEDVVIDKEEEESSEDSLQSEDSNAVEGSSENSLGHILQSPKLTEEDEVRQMREFLFLENLCELFNNCSRSLVGDKSRNVWTNDDEEAVMAIIKAEFVRMRGQI